MARRATLPTGLGALAPLSKKAWTFFLTRFAPGLAGVLAAGRAASFDPVHRDV